MGFWNTVFGFVKVEMPSEPKGDYQTGSILVRVLGWLQAIGLVLGTLFALAIVPIVLLIMGASGAGAEETGIVLGVMVLVMVFVLLFTVAIGLAFLWWLGWILQKWADKEDQGRTHAIIFSSIMLGLSVLGFLSFIPIAFLNSETGVYDDFPGGFAGLTLMSLLNPMTLVQLGAYIWLLVIATRDSTKAIFS